MATVGSTITLRSIFLALAGAVLIAAKASALTKEEFDKSRVAMAYVCYVIALQEMEDHDASLYSRAINFARRAGEGTKDEIDHPQFFTMASTFVQRLVAAEDNGRFYKDECAQPLIRIQKMANDGLLPENPPSYTPNIQKGLEAYQRGEYQIAFTEWSPLAEQGNGRAQYFLAGLYAQGQGVKQNYTTAFKWTKLSAEQGVAEAQALVGAAYNEGTVVPQDYKVAIKWFRLASKQGLALAQYSLAVMHFKGKGTPIDYKLALKWYELAAEQGNKDAQYNLALMYGNGNGTKKNIGRAYLFFSLAALQGHEGAIKGTQIIEKKLNPSQRQHFQKLASQWIKAFCL